MTEGMLSPPNQSAELAALKLAFVATLDDIARIVPPGPGTLRERIEALVVAAADFKALVLAVDECLGHRGAYSCAPTHDGRCERDRSLTGRCVCGADALAAALNTPSARAILEAPDGNTYHSP